MIRELKAAEELVRILKEKEQQDKVELGALEPGETFLIGENEFIVLKQENSQTSVISKELLAKGEMFGNNRNYKESDIKDIIEGDIQTLIENEVGAENLIEHEVDLTSVDMQNEFGSLKCKVRPITFNEAREFNDLLVNEDLDDWYWTLSPWSAEKREYNHSVCVVAHSGCIGSNYYYDGHGVRPFCILKSDIFVSKGGK